jgi:hypothetical protein
MALTRLRLERLLKPFANGREFGLAGEYEQLLGKATFAIDPRHASNRSIVDLDLAARDASGRVCFQADVRVLRPADARRANRRLVLDVVNRGNPVAIRNTDLGVPRTPEPESQGWLLQQGYTIVSCGWQHNVPPKPRASHSNPRRRSTTVRRSSGRCEPSCSYDEFIQLRSPLP